MSTRRQINLAQKGPSAARPLFGSPAQRGMRSVNTLMRLNSNLLRKAGRVFSFGGVLLIALLPRYRWYRALWRISRVLSVFIKPILPFTSYGTDHQRAIPVARMLDYWISRLIHAKGAFPIPIRVRGGELIQNLFCNPRGAAVCSAHLPLLDLCLRSLIEMGCPPTAVVSVPGLLAHSMFLVCGEPTLPGLPADRAVLLKVRTVLRNGGFVAALVDDNYARDYSHNLFRIVQSTGAKVVFVIPELYPNGDIDIEFFLPPDPSCQSEESICQNLQVLQSRVDRVLRRTS